MFCIIVSNSLNLLGYVLLRSYIQHLLYSTLSTPSQRQYCIPHSLTYRIQRLRRNDEATYRCVARNSAGSDFDEKRISFTCAQPSDVDIVGDRIDEMYELGKGNPYLVGCHNMIISASSLRHKKGVFETTQM